MKIFPAEGMTTFGGAGKDKERNWKNQKIGDQMGKKKWEMSLIGGETRLFRWKKKVAFADILRLTPQGGGNSINSAPKIPGQSLAGQNF